METDFRLDAEKIQNSLPNENADLKNNNLFYKLRRHFKSYCNHTSIHGFQYFGQDRTVFEKCLWVFIFLATSIGCSFAIYLIYDKWQKSPVIVSLTTKDTPIYLVPFPAVTLCPTIKFASDHIKYDEQLPKLFETKLDDDGDYDSEEIDITDLEFKLFRYMIPLCEFTLKIGVQNLVSGNMTLSEDVYDHFLKCSPYVNSTDRSVNFMEEFMSNEEGLRPTLTEDGLCFTFNMLSTQEIYTESAHIHPGFKTTGPKSEWIPQRGYSKEAGLKTYPFRAAMSGAMHSLDIRIVNNKKDISYLCAGALQGYKVSLHFPTRIPRSTLEFTMAPFGKATTISVHPQMMTTSDVIKSYPPEKRDCYFENEKNLKFFRIYSKNNCLIECLTNYTLKECGCVSFYMPREASTPICGISKLQCVIDARKRYNLSKLESKLEEYRMSVRTFQTDSISTTINVTSGNASRTRRAYDSEELDLDEEDDEDSRCDCLRACNDITYSGTATTVDFNWKNLMFGPLREKVKDGVDITQISVFLGTNTIFTTERNELYGPTDFLSNFGGLLGLFTGFSILSLMEILYFCTFRIFGNVRIFGRWYGED